MIILNKGDKVAVVSLSAGTLGESFCVHQVELANRRLKELGLEVVYMENALKGIDYLKEHPEAKCKDLISAFKDKSIKGIFCAIGGIDAFKIAPYLLTEENINIVKANPKFFMGYSDTTINHLLLYKMGLNTFYGLSVLTCFAELDKEMLEYSKASFENIFTENDFIYKSADVWYEERTDFSKNSLGTSRVVHKEARGYELLQGASKFSGRLIGGCIETLADLFLGARFPEEVEYNKKYQIFPNKQEFAGKILFLETSEEHSSPKKLELMLSVLKEQGVFEKLAGVLIGKPQNEVYYEEYKEVYKRVLREDIPVVYNVNFGHAYPKMLLQYGAIAEVDMEKKEIRVGRE